MSNTHRMRYKNEGVDSKELRRRREEEGIQLRKQKRDIQLFKRRNINETIQNEDVDVSVIFLIMTYRHLSLCMYKYMCICVLLYV